MHALAVAAALAFSYTLAYGLACVLLPSGRRDVLTLMITTLGLSLGILTIVMFWVALLFPGRLSLAVTLVPCAVVAGIGVWLTRKDLRPDPVDLNLARARNRASPILIALAGAIALISIGILFNALYWPFADWDALAVYAPLGKRIFETGALPVGDLYEGYPMLVPLAYAFSHWVTGGVNEYVARLTPAVMALGTVAAAGALGREMRSTRVGVGAAGLVVLTPIFGRWASSGYVDVPAAFYFTLTAFAAWRWLQRQAWQDALLTGAFTGLALWTKSDALTLCVSLAVLVSLRWWQGRRSGERPPLQWTHVALMGGAILVVAGPWYARNLALLGFFLPNTAWTSLARHDLATLLIMFRDRQHFEASGGLFYLALLYGGARAVAEGSRRVSAWAALLTLVTPFLAAWWWLASYDARFLVTAVPVMSVLAACMIDDGVAYFSARSAPAARRWTAWAGVLVVLILAPLAMQKAVVGKWAILHNPLMSDAEKHHEQLGGVYEVAVGIDRLPEGSRIIGVPALSLYHIDTRRFGELSQAVPDAAPWDYEMTYDYAVYHLGTKEVPGWSHSAAPILKTDDGYYVYATRRPGAG